MGAMHRSATAIAGRAHEYNKIMYEAGWRYYALSRTQSGPRGKKPEPFAGQGERMLEIGPGKFPHCLPVDRSHFIDLSEDALAALRAAGGNTSSARAACRTMTRRSMSCAFSRVIEHVDDDVAFSLGGARP
jgi:hypothetical protein